jgi:RNA-binding protein YhbY
MEKITQMQLGKQGITDNFISTLKTHFDKNKNVKVHILKSAGHDKTKVKEYANEIVEKLGKNYTSKVVGFTIFLKKWRKNVR